MIQPAVAGVIGWPIAHSKSPIIHRFWLDTLKIDGDYSRFPVAPGRLEQFVAAMPAMGLRGVNVTVPHKILCMAQLDALSDGAAAIGAVNTILVGEDGRLSGHNTDIAGILLPAAGHMFRRVVIVLGSGGAARAAGAAARAAGASALFVCARNQAEARGLQSSTGLPGGVIPWGGALPDDAGLLFNATRLGMVDQPSLTIDLSPLPADAVVFDAVYAPLDTSLIKAARARGLATIDGLAMLIGQAADAFRLFYGADPPREHDAELRARLTA